MALHGACNQERGGRGDLDRKAKKSHLKRENTVNRNLGQSKKESMHRKGMN